MATTYTTNYNLGKQENHADKFDMDVITDNADKIDAALTGLQSSIDGKQAALTTAQLAAVNSGIDSTKVAQIETNKNNILSTVSIGTCTTAGNVAAKVVTISDNSWTPHKGSIIAVKFSNSNNVTDTESTPITLNVNNTGAYRIWYRNGAYVNASQVKIFGYAGYYIYYMFDGVDRWLWLNYSMDSTYSAMTQSEASAGTATNERLITAKVLSDTIDEKIQPLENNILLLEQANGAKNLYKFEDLGATAGSGSGVTLTDNGDGTFSATGTASGANYARYLLKQLPIKAGNYIISGISGGALTSYRLRVGTGSGDAYIVNLEDNYAQFTIATDTTITVQFVINSGVTVTNLSIKPMIITKAMYDAGFTDFAPYAMSNAEITAWILAHS